jgi:hypothetical protein
MLLATTPRLLARDRAGLPRGLSGTPVSQFWLGPPAAYYAPAAAQAKSLGYSLPAQAAPTAAGGAIVEYVNPDGTLGQITNWQAWPPTPVSSDPAFIPPPTQAIWQAYMAQLGTAQYASSAQVAQQLQSQTQGQIDNPCASNYIGTIQCNLSNLNASTTSSTTSTTTACDSSSVSLMGYCIPYWGIGAAVVAFFVFGGKR